MTGTPSPATPTVTSPTAPSSTKSETDQGSLLIVTMILTVVLASVVLAVTSYAAVGLRMSQVTDGRLGRLATAEAGIWWGAEQLVAGESCGELRSRAHEVDLRLNDQQVELACETLDPDAVVPSSVERSDVYVLTGTVRMHGHSTTVRATVQVVLHDDSYQVLAFEVHG